MPGAAFDFSCNGCARDVCAAFLFDDDVKRGLLARQPGASVQEFQNQFRWLCDCGRRLFRITSGLVGIA